MKIMFLAFNFSLDVCVSIVSVTQKQIVAENPISVSWTEISYGYDILKFLSISENLKDANGFISLNILN